MINKCNRCNSDLLTGDIDGHCSKCKYEKSLPSHGWQCPICGAVYSPFKMNCDNCVGTYEIKLGGNTTELSRGRDD